MRTITIRLIAIELRRALDTIEPRAEGVGSDDEDLYYLDYNLKC